MKVELNRSNSLETLNLTRYMEAAYEAQAVNLYRPGLNYTSAEDPIREPRDAAEAEQGKEQGQGAEPESDP